MNTRIDTLPAKSTPRSALRITIHIVRRRHPRNTFALLSIVYGMSDSTHPRRIPIVLCMIPWMGLMGTQYPSIDLFENFQVERTEARPQSMSQRIIGHFVGSLLAMKGERENGPRERLVIKTYLFSTAPCPMYALLICKKRTLKKHPQGHIPHMRPRRRANPAAQRRWKPPSACIPRHMDADARTRAHGRSEDSERARRFCGRRPRA